MQRAPYLLNGGRAGCAALQPANAPSKWAAWAARRQANDRRLRRTGGRLTNRVRSGFPDSRLSGFGSVIINDAVKQEFGIEPEERFGRSLPCSIQQTIQTGAS